MNFFLTFEEKCTRVKAFCHTDSSWNKILPTDSMEMRYIKYSLEAENYIWGKKVSEYFFNIASELRFDDVMHNNGVPRK